MVSIVIAAVVGLLACISGIVVGVRLERLAWLSRARAEAPYYCDGKYYYVLPQRDFVCSYRTVPEEDRTARSAP